MLTACLFSVVKTTTTKRKVTTKTAKAARLAQKLTAKRKQATGKVKTARK